MLLDFVQFLMNEVLRKGTNANFTATLALTTVDLHTTQDVHIIIHFQIFG